MGNNPAKRCGRVGVPAPFPPRWLTQDSVYVAFQPLTVGAEEKSHRVRRRLFYLTRFKVRFLLFTRLSQP